MTQAQYKIDIVHNAIEADAWINDILNQNKNEIIGKLPHLIYASRPEERTDFLSFMAMRFEQENILDFSCSNQKFIEVLFDESTYYLEDSIIDTFNEIQRTACYANEYENIIGMDIENLCTLFENMNIQQHSVFQKYFSNLCSHACVVLFYDPDTKDMENISKTILEIEQMMQTSSFYRYTGERWMSPEQIKFNFPIEAFSTRAGIPIGNERVVDNNNHIAVYGSTGTGKTFSLVMPMISNLINKNESIIVIDPKGELTPVIQWEINNKEKSNYRCYFIDLANPHKSTVKWNPLSMIRRLLQSQDPADRDKGDTLLNALADAIYPDEAQDPFWPEAARTYFKGIVYGLIECGKSDEVNIGSVANMMSQSETKVLGNLAIKEFYDNILSADSIAKYNLASYVSAPNETRGSIHSVADNGIAKFNVSKGLTKLLSEDTLNILDIDTEHPFVISIIVPDYTEASHAVAGYLVNQVITHLIQTADNRYDRKLPVAVNCILEELGSVGKKGLPELPRWISTNRSRNIRFVLILQNYEQLVSAYGKESAEIIKSNTKTNVCFSTPEMGTLKEWSDRCGERIIHKSNGVEFKEPLITPQNLEAMPVGTALFMIDGNKFISHLQPYGCIIGNKSDENLESKPNKIDDHKPKIFNMSKMVHEWKRQNLYDEIRAR